MIALGALVTPRITGPKVGSLVPPANPRPVVVLMDSPLPGRVYDPRTQASGGTNADDITDGLRDLPLVIQKENTSAMWHREDQVVRMNPDLIVSHLSCLLDERYAGSDSTLRNHLFDLATSRLLLFYGYVATSNPRTRFLVYSRTSFPDSAAKRRWVAESEARLPVLSGRLDAFGVPARSGGATFRDPETSQRIREHIREILRLD